MAGTTGPTLATDQELELKAAFMNAIAAPVRRKLNAPQPAAALFPYHPGSLLSINDLSLEALGHILSRAAALEMQDPLTRDRILAKRRVALLFYESSTRTRTSFE